MMTHYPSCFLCQKTATLRWFLLKLVQKFFIHMVFNFAVLFNAFRRHFIPYLTARGSCINCQYWLDQLLIGRSCRLIAPFCISTRYLGIIKAGQGLCCSCLLFRHEVRICQICTVDSRVAPIATVMLWLLSRLVRWYLSWDSIKSTYVHLTCGWLHRRLSML